MKPEEEMMEVDDRDKYEFPETDLQGTDDKDEDEKGNDEKKGIDEGVKLINIHLPPFLYRPSFLN